MQELQSHPPDVYDLFHQLYLYHELPEQVLKNVVPAFSVKHFIDLSPKPSVQGVVDSVAVLVYC